LGAPSAKVQHSQLSPQAAPLQVRPKRRMAEVGV